MAELKPAYLIHGDDHGAVAERRAGLRALAEQQGDAASVELLEGDAGTPAGVALALSAMTFAIGRRVIIVDGVERWKQAEVEQHLTPAMAQMPPDTTRRAVRARGGPQQGARGGPRGGQARGRPDRRADDGQAVGAGASGRASRPRGMGLALDAAAAKALVAQVGERQQRLLRELEKLALEVERRGGDPAR